MLDRPAERDGPCLTTWVVSSDLVPGSAGWPVGRPPNPWPRPFFLLAHRRASFVPLRLRPCRHAPRTAPVRIRQFVLRPFVESSAFLSTGGISIRFAPSKYKRDQSILHPAGDLRRYWEAEAACRNRSKCAGRSRAVRSASRTNVSKCRVKSSIRSRSRNAI